MNAKRLWLNRIEKWLAHYDWQVVGALWVVSLILGYVGFRRHAVLIGDDRTFWDTLYLAMQLFTMESGSVHTVNNWPLEVARLMAPFAAVYTAVVALAALFRDQLQLLRVRFIKGHTVICGLGRRGLLLAKQFIQRGDQVVIVERNQGSELIDQCRDLGAIVVIGDASDEEILVKAGVHRADHLIAVCGEDGVNAEIAVDARDMSGNRKRGPLSCVVHIDDLELCRLLKGQELVIGKADSFRLEFFNTYLEGAKALLEERPPFYDGAEGHRPHLLVVGVGKMGESLVVRAARSWRNCENRSADRLKITLIDRNAEERRKVLLLKNPLLEGVCELRPLSMDVQSAEFLEGGFLFDENGACRVTRVYILLDSDTRGLATAMILVKRLRGFDVPIVVRLSHEGGLGTLFHGVDEFREGFGSLFAFGLMERTCVPDLLLRGTHEALARALYREHIELRGRPADGQQASAQAASWDELPNESRVRYERQADRVGELLKAVGCTMEPLGELGDSVFVFTDEEAERLARSIHDKDAEELHRGRGNGTELVERTGDGGAVPWDLCNEKTREAYRDLVRGLPIFLNKVDFQIYRLK